MLFYYHHPILQGFSCFLLKPYTKGVTHFCEVEWWGTLMVECVTFIYCIVKKTVKHSTIKVLHYSTSQKCVTAFPCSLSRAYPNEYEDKLQQFAMVWTGRFKILNVLQFKIYYCEIAPQAQHSGKSGTQNLAIFTIFETFWA